MKESTKKNLKRLLILWSCLITATVVFLAGYITAGIIEFDRGFVRAAKLCSQGEIERGMPVIAGAVDEGYRKTYEGR